MKTFVEIWDEVKNIGTERMLLQESAERMYKYIVKYKPKQCVEIGTHRARSAIFIGRLLENWDGVLSTIDPYRDFIIDDGTLLFEGRSPEWFREDAQNNITNAGLADRITMIRLPSVEGALKFMDDSLHLLYIDGDHSREAIAADIRAWDRKVRKGGIILIDDWEEMQRRVPPLPTTWIPLNITGHLAFWEKGKP
jgi:predicted O-methyltransferase YrrM